MDQYDAVIKFMFNPLVIDKDSHVRLLLIIIFTLIGARVIKETLSFAYKIFKVIVGIFKPIDYEHDMTSEKYCKFLAEVNNNLQIQTRLERVTQISSTDQSTAHSRDCVTGALASAQHELHGNVADNEFPKWNPASKKEIVSGSHDYVYPNGWLPLMESAKVKRDEIKRAIFIGRDLIVTRSKEGEINVLDAYCPHMGVNIGVGGRVRRVNNESCVQCPFHGWTFRASDGQCVSIPYVRSNSKCSIPKQARLRTWNACEVDNFIYVWHHIDDQPPSWHLEPTAELVSGKFILAGRSCHTTNLDIRDMHENGADMNHFEGIHNDIFVLGSNFLKVQAYNSLQKYTRHHWSPDWKPILNEAGKVTHMAEMNLDSWISLFKLRLFDIQVRATQIGPACVQLRYHSSWYGNGVLKMNAVPLGGRRTLYVQHIYTESSLFNWIMAKFVLLGEIMQLERDLFIWNHKKNLSGPAFIPEDKIIKRFRLWYSQFYKRKCRIQIQDSSIDKQECSINHNSDLLEF